MRLRLHCIRLHINLTSKTWLSNFNLISPRYYDIVRDVRQNKGSILKASVEYIKKLKSDQHKKRLLEEKCRIQESQNRKLLLKLQVSTNLVIE